MLAGTPRIVEELLHEAGVPASSLPEVALAAAGTGRFVLFDSQNSRSATRARRAQRQGLQCIDLRNLLPSGADAAQLGQDADADPHLAFESSLARPFLEQLKLTLEELGGAWVRVADYPFPFQSVISVGIRHVSDELADFASIAAALPGQATHFVSSRLRSDRLQFLSEAGEIDLAWQIESDERNASARRTLSHWTTRRMRFRDAFLHPQGILVEGEWKDPPSSRKLRELGFDYSCHESPGVACRALARPRGVFEPDWIRFNTLALPPQLHFVDWIGRHYQSGCPLFLTASTNRLDLVRELMELSADARRCTLMWRASFGLFARWWRLRQGVKLSVWRREHGYEIHAGGEFGSFAWGIEIWRGQHHATLPLRQTEMVVADNGLVYALSPRRTPAGCSALTNGLREMNKPADQPGTPDPNLSKSHFRRKGRLE